MRIQSYPLISNELFTPHMLCESYFRLKAPLGFFKLNFDIIIAFKQIKMSINQEE